MGATPELVYKAPDYSSAVNAINMASEILNLASEKMTRKDYIGSFNESKNAIRIAASAPLFKDGCIAQTFEATVSYLNERYPNRFPLKEWESVENKVTGEGSGLLNILIRSLGKHAGEKEAKHALDTAREFLEKAKLLVML